MGLGLQIDSVKFIFRRAKVTHRWVELPILLARLSLLPVLAFTFLPWGMALAFIGVQLAVFGFYMGASFAPNHKGMPVLPADSRVDFFSRQVLTSRNISGGRFMDILLGGLNRQAEHHLFPDMARPQLRQGRRDRPRVLREAPGSRTRKPRCCSPTASSSATSTTSASSAGRHFECPMATVTRRY